MEKLRGLGCWTFCRGGPGLILKLLQGWFQTILESARLEKSLVIIKSNCALTSPGLLEPPLLQDKQSLLPQPLLTGLVFQTPHQHCCPSLDMFQSLHVLFKVGGPELDTGLGDLPNQCQAQYKNYCSGPASNTIPDPGEEPLAFLATWAHCWLMSISAPRSLSAWPLSSHSVPSLEHCRGCCC